MLFFFDLDSDVVARLTLNHLRALRDSPLYRDAYIFIYVEINMSYIQADWLAKLIAKQKDLGQIEMVSYEKDSASATPRYGVWTGPQQKEEYATHLAQLLRDGLIRYASYIVGANPEETIQTAEEQLKTYRKEIQKPSNHTFGKYKFAYSGKSDGCKDDLAMVFQMFPYWMNYKRSDERFQEMAIMRNWRN